MSVTVCWLAAATAVPDRAIVKGEFGALLAIVNVPVGLPGAVGSKLTV